MKKFELIDAISAATGHPKTTVREILDEAARAVRESVRRGADVFLFGIGKLSIVRRGEKKARNIHTGEPVVVPPRNVVLYRPSSSVESAANERA